MMTLFRNYRPPPAGSTHDQPKAGHIAYSLRPGSLGIQSKLLPGRYAGTRIIPKASPCSAHAAWQRAARPTKLHQTMRPIRPKTYTRKIIVNIISVSYIVHYVNVGQEIKVEV